jgi:2-amino-4-hydroxy-6-hydroxymethyldihydropteridine diphosphokinase
MAIVYVGIGSNIDPENNIHLCMSELRRRYREVQASAVYRSNAVGFEGDDFLNLVASFESERSPQAICEDIEMIHNLVGRSRDGGKWASRPLDIDLLLYNDLVMSERPVRVPREDILEYSFVLRPLAELAPDLVHPVTGQTMLKHWQEFDGSGQPLEPAGVIV